MRCPDLTKLVQSSNKGKNRTEKAINILGIDVVNRIYSFVLYSLGYSYEDISEIIGGSKPGVKRTINEVFNNGVHGFLDKRKKTTNKQIGSIVKKRGDVHENTIECTIYDSHYLKYQLHGNFNIKIKKDDTLSKKILTLLLYESGIIDQQQASNILDCHRNTVASSVEKLRLGGSKVLLDGRTGQQKDYKFSSKVKAEIVNAFIQDIMDEKIPSKTTISNRLNDNLPEEYSTSAVAFHLKRIGFTDNKKVLIRSILAKVNEKIESLEYLDPYQEYSESRVYIEPMKNIRENLKEFSVNVSEEEYSIFELETKIENIQSNFQPVVLESVIEELKENFACPFCYSRSINVNHKNGRDRVVKTSLGGEWNLSKNMYMNGKCKDCQKEFDILKDLLKLPEYTRFTPLTQKKICSANVAKSYDCAAINLKQQIGLDINKKQVRNISTRVGGYINHEFKEIYKKIKKGKNRAEIARQHPLITQLEIDKKYLDKSKYIIIVAVDGGRMQLFNWIPPNDSYEKARKKTYWHENKVFRISIYDKAILEELVDSIDGIDVKQRYQCAKIIPEQSTYGATNVSWKECAPLILSHLYVRGIDTEDVQLCLSDGSEHIMKGVFTPLFPNSLHILDYYHKSEALHSCLKSIDLTDKEINVNQLKKYLWNGKVESLIDDLKKMQVKVGFPEKGKKRNPDNPKVKLDNFIKHLSNNKKRLRYKKFRDMKYPIGSGSVESAVKLFGKRIKGTEKQWNEEGAESILHLYAFLLSRDDRWDKLWAYQKPWLSK